MSAPITTETILHEDGAEAALAQFASQVREGEAAVRRLLKKNPDRVWRFSELRDAAAEGRRKTAMGAALRSLALQDVLSIDYVHYTVEAL